MVKKLTRVGSMTIVCLLLIASLFTSVNATTNTTGIDVVYRGWENATGDLIILNEGESGVLDLVIEGDNVSTINNDECDITVDDNLSVISHDLLEFIGCYEAVKGDYDFATSYNVAMPPDKIGFIDNTLTLVFEDEFSSCTAEVVVEPGATAEHNTVYDININGTVMQVRVLLNPKTVTFNPSGGKIGGSSATATKTFNNRSVTLSSLKPTNPVKAGYTFTGWETAGGTLLTDSSTITSSTDLTAIYKANPTNQDTKKEKVDTPKKPNTPDRPDTPDKPDTPVIPITPVINPTTDDDSEISATTAALTKKTAVNEKKLIEIQDDDSPLDNGIATAIKVAAGAAGTVAVIFSAIKVSAYIRKVNTPNIQVERYYKLPGAKDLNKYTLNKYISNATSSKLLYSHDKKKIDDFLDEVIANNNGSDRMLIIDGKVDDIAAYINKAIDLNLNFYVVTRLNAFSEEDGAYIKEKMERKRNLDADLISIITN